MRTWRRGTGLALAAASALALSGCGYLDDDIRIFSASLADGTYRARFVGGHDPAEEADLLAITARLDRAAGTLVLTLGDGSQRTLGFAPRPRAQWQPDCRTMASMFENEVADLSPAPLQLGSLSFATPLVHAKCGPSRMILADSPAEPAAVYLILDQE